MLLQNQRSSTQYPLRLRGGALAQERAMWGRSERYNVFDGEGLDDNLSAVPNGHLPHSAWLMPRVAGGGSAYSGSGAVSSGTAAGVMGRNGDALGEAASSGTANGIAVSPGTASGASVSSGTASGVGLASGSASGTSISSGTASGIAQASGSATGSATSFGTVVPYATATGSAQSIQTTLTPDGVASAVWAALAAQNDDPGTMGALLNASGAAGDPWAVMLEGTYTAADLLRLIVAHASGDATGLEGANPQFKSLDGTKTRIDGTYSEGNRTITALDPSA